VRNQPVVRALLVARDRDGVVVRQGDRGADLVELVAVGHPHRHLGVDRRDDQVDVVLQAQLDEPGHDVGLIESRNQEGLIGDVECARVPGAVGGEDPARASPDGLQCPLEPAQELDPPASRRNEDGDRLADGHDRLSAPLPTTSAPAAPEPGNSGRVAWPLALMPSRCITRLTVSRRIRTSRRSDL
jgi:hypothetical protein